MSRAPSIFVVVVAVVITEGKIMPRMKLQSGQTRGIPLIRRASTALRDTLRGGSRCGRHGGWVAKLLENVIRTWAQHAPASRAVVDFLVVLVQAVIRTCEYGPMRHTAREST